MAREFVQSRRPERWRLVALSHELAIDLLYAEETEAIDEIS